MTDDRMRSVCKYNGSLSYDEHKANSLYNSELDVAVVPI